MKTKRFLIIFMVIALFLSSLLPMTSCKKSTDMNSSENAMSDGISGNESIGDYFPDISSDLIDSNGDINSNTINSDGTSVSKGGTQSTVVAPTPTKPAQYVDSNKYPTTPGDPNTKKLPAFASTLTNPVIKALDSSVSSDLVIEQLKAFKSLTGIDLKIEVEVVPWANLSTTLASKVLGNNSPDLFTMGVETTPFLVRQNYFQPIADYINMNDGLWVDVQNVNYLAFSAGKQYAVTTSDPKFHRGLIYNKVLFDENDLDYPMDLYKTGKWTWDAMYTAAKEITVDADNDGTPEILGASLPDYTFGLLVNSTGVDFIKYDAAGKIINNLKDAKIQRAADFIFKLGALGVDKESWMWTTRFTQNKIGMVVANPWEMITGAVLEMKKANKIGWVPFPKDPASDKYYAQGQTYFSYIPKNAVNPKATAAWLYFQRYMVKNPSPILEKNAKDIATTKWSWTAEEYTFINKDLSKQLVSVIGAGERVPDFSKQAYLWGMPFTFSWSKTMEEVNPSFQAAIDSFNNR